MCPVCTADGVFEPLSGLLGYMSVAEAIVRSMAGPHATPLMFQDATLGYFSHRQGLRPVLALHGHVPVGSECSLCSPNALDNAGAELTREPDNQPAMLVTGEGSRAW